MPLLKAKEADRPAVFHVGFRVLFAQAHIPGAICSYLNEDLADPIISGVTGRHPLPAIDVVAARFSKWGIDQRVQVVAYDDSGEPYRGDRGEHLECDARPTPHGSTLYPTPKTVRTCRGSRGSSPSFLRMFFTWASTVRS